MQTRKNVALCYIGLLGTDPRANCDTIAFFSCTYYARIVSSTQNQTNV
jgi:hypothetical protein